MNYNIAHAADEDEATFYSDDSVASSERELTLADYDSLTNYMDILSKKIFNDLTEEEQKKFQNTIEEYSPQIAFRIYNNFKNTIQTFKFFSISDVLKKEKKILEKYSQEQIERYIQQIAQGETPINEHPGLILANKRSPHYPLAYQIRRVLREALMGDITFKEGEIINERFLRWIAIHSLDEPE